MNPLEDMRENGKRCVLSARGGGPVLSGMFSEYLDGIRWKGLQSAADFAYF